jgi:hypothetical protein
VQTMPAHAGVLGAAVAKIQPRPANWSASRGRAERRVPAGMKCGHPQSSVVFAFDFHAPLPKSRTPALQAMV